MMRIANSDKLIFEQIRAEYEVLLKQFRVKKRRSQISDEEFDKKLQDLKFNFKSFLQKQKVSPDGVCFCEGKNPNCFNCDGKGYVDVNPSLFTTRGQSDFYAGLENSSGSEIAANFSTLRRENGKFGSYPNEDTYDDESNS